MGIGESALWCGGLRGERELTSAVGAGSFRIGRGWICIRATSCYLEVRRRPQRGSARWLRPRPTLRRVRSSSPPLSSQSMLTYTRSRGSEQDLQRSPQDGALRSRLSRHRSPPPVPRPRSRHDDLRRQLSQSRPLVPLLSRIETALLLLVAFAEALHDGRTGASRRRSQGTR